MKSFKGGWTLIGLALLASHSAMAQEEEGWALRREPLETSITERPWAVRLRLEHATTHDREDLLKEDPAYRRVPTRMWAADVRMIHRCRLIIGSWIDWWTTDQNMDRRRYGGLVVLPLGGSWSSRVRLVQWREDQVNSRRFIYAGACGLVGSRVFSSTEYRHEAVPDASDTHQVYQYISWTVLPRLRLAAQGAGRYGINAWDSWYGGGSIALEVIPEWTSVRIEGLAGGGEAVCDYAESRLIFYQRLWEYLLLRPEYRHYRDRDDRSSHALGVKLLAYPTPALDVQLGYRYYTQDQGADFDTVTIGIGLIF